MSRPASRSATVWLFVVALVLAPALASVWPALGKGPMLYTGEPASHAKHGHDAVPDTAGPDHEHHAAHGDHAAANDAEPNPHADHAQHCALCVLVSLAWAPIVHVATGADAPPAAHQRALRNTTPPRVLVVWTRAPARAPPALS